MKRAGKGAGFAVSEGFRDLIDREIRIAQQVQGLLDHMLISDFPETGAFPAELSSQGSFAHAELLKHFFQAGFAFSGLKAQPDTV